jgi:predicted metalloprotease with PDZ domain
MIPSILPEPGPVRYRVIVRDPHAHLFEVHCTVAIPAPTGQIFRLPTWTPGSYLVREFARHFVHVRAESNGVPVAIGKLAKDTWKTAACSGPVTVVAQVYGYDLSVRAAYIDATRAFFNGASLLLCPDGCAQLPCRIDLVPPDGAAYRGWKVATTLARVDAPEHGFGSYGAANYDELIDHPVEMAEFALAEFAAGGVVHELAVTGRQRADLARLAADLARVCRWQIGLFAAADDAGPPFERYLFQLTVVGDGYGGLEHRSSASLICRRDHLPRAGDTAISDGYRSLLGLASHEYFHAWNVKRIRPSVFSSYDLSRECYTTELWAFEGITSYYDDLALVRSGVIAIESYLELLGRTISAVLRTPGRRQQSVTEASFDAWIKYYRPDENSPNASVSYYTKGALIGLSLDLTLRAAGSSLDELMRALWRQYGVPGDGVPDGAIARLAGALAGRDLSNFFRRYVEGCEDPPLTELLHSSGIRLQLRAAAGDADRGGTPPRDGGVARRSSWAARLAGDGTTRIVHVFAGGAAERCGLAAGDLIVAVDGLRATPEALEILGAERGPGETLRVHAFRRDELFCADLTLDAGALDTCWLTLDPDADEPARARRAAWLG